MSTPVIPAARVQQWRKKLIPQLILYSLFGQLSNQYSVAHTLPKASERKMPSAVVMRVTDEFSNGAYKCTIPAARKPSTTVVRGPNPAAGRENKPQMMMVDAYWNIKRIPYELRDESVEGDILKYYAWAEQTASYITNDFVEDNDYDHQMATIEGADISLWDPAAWQDSEKGSNIANPLERTLHPNFYAWTAGKLVKNSWSHTYATALSNLETKLDDMTVSDTFNLKTLKAIHFLATRLVAPLGGFQGDKSIKWVLKISDVQWNQLFNDVGTGTVSDEFRYVETGFQKLYSGEMKIFRGILIVVDQRSPLAKIESSTVSFQYVTAAGDARSPVATNANANTGTVELAVLYGNGALVEAVKQDVTFKQQRSQDFGFEEALCGIAKRAVRRTDLDTASVATAARKNESSFIVATANRGEDYPS